MEQLNGVQWAGQRAPRCEEPPTAVTVRGLGDQGESTQAQHTVAPGGAATSPAAQTPFPRDGHPLTSIACSCGATPTAVCLACLRWRRHFKTVRARQEAWARSAREAVSARTSSGGDGT